MLGEILGESWQEEYNMVKWRESRNHFWGGQSTVGACCRGCKDKINPSKKYESPVWLVIGN